MGLKLVKMTREWEFVGVVTRGQSASMGTTWCLWLHNFLVNVSPLSGSVIWERFRCHKKVRVKHLYNETYSLIVAFNL